MNSSNMSLKEGFDFLFENEEEPSKSNSSGKWTVTFSPEETSLGDTASKVAFILATDILSATINEKDSTPIQQIFDNPEMSKDLEYAIGKTISIRKLEKISRTPSQFKKLFNITQENVSGPINAIAVKYNHSIANLFAQHDVIGMLLVESKKTKRIKISVREYSRFILRLKSSNQIPKDKRSKKAINLNTIWERCYTAIKNGELVKDGLDIDFKESSKNSVLLYSVKSFLQELTPYQQKSFGVSALKIFMQDLANDEDIKKSYKSFQNNMSSKASVLNRKIMDVLIRSVLDSNNKEEISDKIDQIADIVPEQNDTEEDIVSIDELDELMTSLPADDLPKIDFPAELTDDMQQQKNSDENSKEDDDTPPDPEEEKDLSDSEQIDDSIKEAEEILKNLTGDFDSAQKACDKLDKNNNAEVNFNIEMLQELISTIAYCSIALKFALFSYKKNNRFIDNQEQRFSKVVTSFKSLKDEVESLLTGLKNSDSEKAKDLAGEFTTIAFDTNTASKIDLERLLPDVDKDEVITKVKSEFEEMQTNIGDPTPQTDASIEDDEAKTTDDDQYKVTTTLDQPDVGDYNDFLKKYLAIASFLAITTDASSEILSGSARRLKASELVSALKNWSKKAKVDNDVLSNSISNLAKFTHENVEGIIFERAGANKYFIKMNARSFSGSSFLLQNYMKDNKNDCFADIDIFTPPIFELTDSKGEAFYPDVDAAITHFAITDSKKRSVKKEGDIVKFYLEEKPYFLISEAGGGDFEFRLTALTKSTNKSTARSTDKLKKSVRDLGGFNPVVKMLNLSDEDTGIVKDFMDEYAKTRVADFKSGLSEVDIDLSEDDTRDLADAITTDPEDLDNQPKTQTLVSKGKDSPEIKNNISSVDELSNDKVVRKMMSAIYRDNSLDYFIASIQPIEFAAVKAGKDKRLINDFKARAILAINPELGAIKLNVKDIYNGEMKGVFDTLFSKNYNFNETAMRAVYTKTIVSAFDKLIGKEHSRITEGLFSGIKRMASAAAANLLKMAPVIALVTAISSVSFFAAAIPFIMAGFVSWVTFSSWKDIAKWEQAKRDYQLDPYGYIEKTLFEDKSSRKVIKNIVNAAAADVIVARLNPAFAKQEQSSVSVGLSGGSSEFQKNFDDQMSEFSSLSEEDRRAAKVLNDRVIGQLAKTKYYNSVITEAMINMIFNEVMFGKKRVSNETRKMLLAGKFDMRSEAKKDLQDTLVSIIENSAIKNNLVDFVHKEVKKLKNKRFTKADDAELERRKRYGSAEALDTTGMGMVGAAKAKIGAAMSDNVVGGMYAQYLISPEQIHEEAIDELVQKVVGLSKKEYEKRFEHNRNEDLFSENIIIGSLTKLLFEAPGDEQNDLDSESKEKSFKELQDEREAANRQKDNTTAVLAGLGAGSYVHSLWLSMFMRKYSDKQIVKTILQTIPGKAATAAKYVSKFSPNPASAANDNLLGQDMGHGLFEFTDKGVKKQLYAYYYSEAKYAGDAKALSGQIIDPSSETSKMIQHDLYSYYNDSTNNYYNKMWFNNHGMEVDPTGVVKIIDPNLCKALSANSPEMAKATNIIMTNLEASYPVETSAMEAKLKTFSIWSDFDEDLLNFAGKDKVAVVKAFAKKVMAQKLGGPDMGPHPVHFGDSDPEIKSFINALEGQLKKAAGDSPEAQKAVADAMGEFYKTCKTAVKGGEAFMQTLVKKGQNADAIFSPENADALKSITDKEAKVMVQGFEKSIETIKALVPEESVDVAFKKAVGMVAQQGHNPMLDFDVIPGQAGTASGQNKIRGDYTEGGDKSFFNSLSKGVADYNSVVGPLALASKVLSKFYTRGIKSGELARQLTKMLNFKNIVYTDILNAIIGNNIISVPQGLTKNGDAEKQNLAPDELLQSEGQVQNQGAVRITGLSPSDFKSEQAPAIPRSDEGFVHTVKLSSYLFENKTVTKKKKTSKISSASLSLNEEFKAHSHLKDLFKKLV